LNPTNILEFDFICNFKHCKIVKRITKQL